MLHSVTRIKPFSLGKIHGLLCATGTLLVGLIVNAITVFWGHSALSIAWQTAEPQGQIMLHTLSIKPVEILLMTCILTVIVLIVGFFYGVLMAWLYNFSAGVTGGVQVDLLPLTTRPVAMPVSSVAQETKTTTKTVATPRKTSKTKKVTKKKSA